MFDGVSKVAVQTYVDQVLMQLCSDRTSVQSLISASTTRILHDGTFLTTPSFSSLSSGTLGNLCFARAFSVTTVTSIVAMIMSLLAVR
jgi:hypothetical protein